MGVDEHRPSSSVGPSVGNHAVALNTGWLVGPSAPRPPAETNRSGRRTRIDRATHARTHAHARTRTLTHTRARTRAQRRLTVGVRPATGSGGRGRRRWRIRLGRSRSREQRPFLASSQPIGRDVETSQWRRTRTT